MLGLIWAKVEILLDIEDFRDDGGILSLRIYDLNKPIIAAVNGPAVEIGAKNTIHFQWMTPNGIP
ncbi:hypothetical protein ABRT01_13575 [Lentibacillus sp. L22]|uniref:hypothetical protein n=1 Tax=Lentibacillus sp. L22 TaxID=3163028 RepID=UPI0034676AC6